MTLKTVKEMIQEIGLPFAYYQFPEGTAQPCPFVVFYYPASDDLAADNSNYAKITQLVIELYTDQVDFDLVAKIEEVLTAAGLTWAWTETFLDDERMHLTTFTTEVLINGEQG